MIIGDKADFAIEYEITQYKPYFWGKVCIWVNNCYMGYYNEEVYLSYVKTGLNNILKNKDRLYNPKFDNKSDVEVFNIIDQNLTNRISNEFDVYSVGLGESFDDFMIYAIYHKRKIKFLWKLQQPRRSDYMGYSGNIHSGCISEDDFEKILNTYENIFPNIR